MSLTEIKRYIRENERVSLEEMSIFFKTDMDTMRGIMDGMVADDCTPLSKKKSCGKCKNCTCHTRKQYRWMDDPGVTGPMIH